LAADATVVGHSQPHDNEGTRGGTRTHGLSLRRAALYPLSYQRVFLVPKVGFEPTRAIAHYALNVARLPFRHFGAGYPVYILPIPWVSTSRSVGSSGLHVTLQVRPGSSAGQSGGVLSRASGVRVPPGAPLLLPSRLE
jgi:hypothetical protein